MKILVTGASGFIGKNIIKYLSPDHQYVATYLSSSNFLDFIHQNNLRNVKPYKIDLTSPPQVKTLSKQHPAFDACIFLAANGDPATSENSPVYDLQSNTITLINTIENINIEKFIYFSSGAVYHRIKGKVNPNTLINPKLPYAISNYASEQYIKFFEKEKKLQKWLIARFFGAFGEFEPERKIYTKLIKSFLVDKKKDFIIKGAGNNLIDAMYVSDTINAVRLMLEGDYWNQTLDLYSGNPLTITQLVEKTARYLNVEINIKHEGSVPEYIEFFSDDKTMEKIYQFTPKISLQEGLSKLTQILLNQP